MASVVFLKGVNIGGHRTFRPSVLASKLAKLGVINLGAAGTFVVRKPISEARLRLELKRHLPFETEVMICSGKDILQLASTGPFNQGTSDPDVVRFVSVLAKGPRVLPVFPLNLPNREEWLVRIVEVRGRFAFGEYRRSLRTIGLLNKIEKYLGGSVTSRSWNTFSNLFEILRTKPQILSFQTGRSK